MEKKKGIDTRTDNYEHASAEPLAVIPSDQLEESVGAFNDEFEEEYIHDYAIEEVQPLPLYEDLLLSFSKRVEKANHTHGKADEPKEIDVFRAFYQATERAFLELGELEEKGLRVYARYLTDVYVAASKCEVPSFLSFGFLQIKLSNLVVANLSDYSSGYEMAG